MLPDVSHIALVRLAQSYRRPVERALLRAAIAVAVVGVVAGAHAARTGTLGGRVGGAALVAVCLAALLIHRLWFRRRFRSDSSILATAVAPASPRSAAKVTRALGLVERSRDPDAGQSLQLARLHLERCMDGLDATAVDQLAGRRARSWRQLALVAGAGCVLVAGVAPWHIAEGLNVMAARRGVAPLRTPWLELVTVGATPPSYLRQNPSVISFDASTAIPEGTEISVRGVPVRSGRELVLTDGTLEVPFAQDGSGSVVAHWTLEETVKLRVGARFGDTLVLEPRALELFSQPDQVPTVELTGAPAEYRLEELDKLELLWRARDDHSLIQVDLVLRSAGKEERRTLDSFPGDKRAGQGGHVLYPTDPFLERAFLPVLIRIEARDNDPREGSKWGKSPTIVVRPPGVGSPQVNRYKALDSLRKQLVELLAEQLELDAEKDKERSAQRAAAIKERLANLRQSKDEVLNTSYSGLYVPRGWGAFIEGQMQRLETAYKRKRKETETLESIVLGVNAAMESLAARDSQDVARQLGDVAEEAAFAARLAQQPEDLADGKERLSIATGVLESGAKELLFLESLGQDLGSVALADLGRVTRSVGREDYFHAELAALHMAERLHRPNKSFGAKGGGGGGVESGSGGSGGQKSDAQGQPSDADKQFDRMARDLQQLAQEHADLSGRTSDAMRDAERGASGSSDKDEASQRADALRRSVVGLPQPGETPGTARASAALAREHAGAMAHELDQLDFEGAVESGQRARSAAQEALRSNELDAYTRKQLMQALQEIESQLSWAKEQAQRQSELTEQAARDALSEFSKLEKELAERAGHLGQEAPGEAALPQQIRDRLQRAAQLMHDAASRLRDSRGKEAMDLQTEAQRLLEQSETGETQDKGAQDQPGKTGDTQGGRNVRTGGDVPDAEAENGARDFRRRVLEGLGDEAGGRLSPAVKRYAEGLLR